MGAAKDAASIHETGLGLHRFCFCQDSECTTIWVVRCLNGYECEFCHYEHEKRKRKNKKNKKKKAPCVRVAAAVQLADTPGGW